MFRKNLFLGVAIGLVFSIPGPASTENHDFWCGPNSTDKICNPKPTGPVACPFTDPKLCSVLPIPKIFQGGQMNDAGETILPLAPVIALVGPTRKVNCSGVIVGKDKILTAAHCTCPTTELGKKLDSVVYGRTTNDDVSYSFQITDVFRFNESYCDTQDRIGLPDFAILEVDVPQAFNPELYAQLWPGDSPYNGPGIVAGFGVSLNEKEGGVKGFWEYPDVVSCSDMSSEKYGCKVSSELLALVEKRQTGGGCHADSGGPLINAHGQIAGILTRGVKRGQTTHDLPCGAGDIFSAVLPAAVNSEGQLFENWFKEVME